MTDVNDDVPESDIGPEIPDPWSDPDQTDWPDNDEMEVEE